MLSCPILTYHSQNIRGNGYAQNDHVALRTDIEALHQAGWRIIALDRLADRLDHSDERPKARPVAGPVARPKARPVGMPDPTRTVVLTFDDGCDFDVEDLEYPGHGLQRSFRGILTDFIAAHGPAAQPELHATSFVIASRQARQVIDAGSLFGHGWISDHWWRETDAAGLIAIGNHGWDHNHPDLAGTARGNFHTVDTHAQCLEQVVRAAAAIDHVTGRWPAFFAYPFGESSAYIRDRFFPDHAAVHGCRAALGTEPGHVTRRSNRWNLPRYVCGRDWNTPEALMELVGA